LQPEEQRKPISYENIRNRYVSKDCEDSYYESSSFRTKSFSCRNRQNKEKNSIKTG